MLLIFFKSSEFYTVLGPFLNSYRDCYKAFLKDFQCFKAFLRFRTVRNALKQLVNAMDHRIIKA